jgi:hypothetical protein
MAKTASVPRGSTPPSSTPPKCNKRDGNNDASNEQKRQKTNNNAKSKEALDDTSCKTGAVTVHDVVNFVVTACTADLDSSGNAQPDKQQPKQQSKETTKSNESNADDPKTPENNIKTPVCRSTVSKKTMFSILENIDLFYLSLIIIFSLP